MSFPTSRRSFIVLAAGSVVASWSWTAMTHAAVDDKPAKEKPADPEPKADVVVDENSDGKTIKAKVGDLIEFRLKGEREHTGWGGGPPKHPGGNNKKPPVLERGNDDFKPEPNAKESAIGTYIIRAKAYEAGSVNLIFRYIYPDGHGHEFEPRLATQVVREFKVTIEVS